MSVVGVTTVATALLAATDASAVLAGSTFQGSDGNMVVDPSPAPGTTDWANIPTGSLNTGTDKPSGSTDNSFGQGTKEDVADVSVVAGSIPPSKNDLTRFYESSEQAANSHIYLYLAWERAKNVGSANLDFEINKNATTGFTANSTGPITINRTAGDLLVTYDFGGSGSPTLGLLRWVTSASLPVVPGFATNTCFSANAFPCWGDRTDLTAAGDAEGAVNAGTITESIAGGTLTAGLFGETSIDLTAAGVFQQGVCSAFGTTFIKSRSSSSFTAEVKDFIAPQSVQISNCGTVNIHKTTENGDSTFNYTTSGGFVDGSGTDQGFTLSNGGTKSFSNVNAATYHVIETLTAAQQTAGWTLSGLTCTSTNHNSTFSYSGGDATINMTLGDTVDCYYTNHINAKPLISTTLSATTINAGGSVHDSAALSGATSGAGGTVTYHAYAGQNTCTGTDLLNDTQTVSGGAVPDSKSITLNTAGYYSFQAVYSGDGNNDPATSVCSTEQLLVKANPTISTTLSTASIVVGSTVHDSATLSGKTADAGGTVTYTVYTDSACSQNARAAGTVTVTNGGVPDSNGLVFNTAGTFYWQAVYSGDTKNNGATSTCTEEQLIITLKQPTASTAQNLKPNDSFTLASGFNPTGSITFNLYDPSDATCSGTPALTQTVTGVNGNGTYSTTNTTFIASAEGTWRWKVTYSGDLNNLGVTSACGVEQFTIANH